LKFLLKEKAVEGGADGPTLELEPILRKALKATMTKLLIRFVLLDQEHSHSIVSRHRDMKFPLKTLFRTGIGLENALPPQLMRLKHVT
jgi:hypothetical protein